MEEQWPRKLDLSLPLFFFQGPKFAHKTSPPLHTTPDSLISKIFVIHSSSPFNVTCPNFLFSNVVSQRKSSDVFRIQMHAIKTATFLTHTIVSNYWKFEKLENINIFWRFASVFIVTHSTKFARSEKLCKSRWWIFILNVEK